MGLLAAAVTVLAAVAGWDYVAETCSEGSKGPKRILTVAVMSPATGASRLVLGLVPFALLTDASGCYHMCSGILHGDL